jgi:hypothetical protein
MYRGVMDGGKKKRDTELKTSSETTDEIKTLSSDVMPLR